MERKTAMTFIFYWRPVTCDKFSGLAIRSVRQGVQTYGKDRNSRTLPPAVPLSTSTFTTGFIWPLSHRPNDLEQWVPNFSWHQNHLEDCESTDCWALPAGILIQKDQGWSWIMCISSKFQVPLLLLVQPLLYFQMSRTPLVVGLKVSWRKQLNFYGLHFIAFSNLFYTSHRKDKLRVKAKSEWSTIRCSQSGMQVAVLEAEWL